MLSTRRSLYAALLRLARFPVPQAGLDDVLKEKVNTVSVVPSTVSGARYRHKVTGDGSSVNSLPPKIRELVTLKASALAHHRVRSAVQQRLFFDVFFKIYTLARRRVRVCVTGGRVTHWFYRRS